MAFSVIFKYMKGKISMKVQLMDYAIVQRNDKGYAEVTFEGDLNLSYGNGERVVARIVREDDNLVIGDLTKCEVKDGHWSVDLTLPEGGLYRIEAIYAAVGCSTNWGRKIKCVHHIGVGDLYMTAGQSNMSGYGRETAYDPPCLGVHALYCNGKWRVASHPLHDGVDSLYEHNDGAAETSPALSFARRLYQELHIPIGIIPAAIGGSPLRDWNPDEDGCLWREAFARTEICGGIKGIIWSQGCADGTPELAPTYLERFKTTVKLWRKDMNSEFPILIVQANRWVGQSNGDNADEKYWGMIRDAQRRSALEIEGVYTIPSYDLPTSDGIHNGSASNVVVGERLAGAALYYIYNKPGRPAVMVEYAERQDENHVVVYLTPGRPMSVMDGTAIGMNVEDADGLIDCVKSYTIGNGLCIETERPYKLPAYFHFSWRYHTAMFMPRDQNGMPMLACYGVEIQEQK